MTKLPIPFEEFIRGERIQAACEKINGVKFIKGDSVTRDSVAGGKVIVTHRSDRSVHQSNFNLAPSTMKMWYAQNAEYVHEKLRGIPIGVNNSITKIYGRAEAISEIWETPKDHKNLCYMNFFNTHGSRREVRSAFQDKPWVTKGTFDQTEAGFSKYISDIYNHKFVISPRGNGVDCVRTWDCLYLGTIPIVPRSYAMSFFEDLPILFINNWGQVTEDFLNQAYEDMSKKEYNYDKLLLSYWVNKFKESL